MKYLFVFKVSSSRLREWGQSSIFPGGRVEYLPGCLKWSIGTEAAVCGWGHWRRGTTTDLGTARSWSPVCKDVV